MNVELSWVLGTAATIVIAGVTGYIKLTERITRVETAFAMMGEKAARIMHSPHTPELDNLLDKYLDRNYELSHDEWDRLLKICDDMVDDPTKAKESRMLAAILSVISHHKLMHPAPVKKSFDDRMAGGDNAS